MIRLLDRHRQAEAIYQQALDVPREQIEAFLAGACGDDAVLLNDVRQLLAHRDQLATADLKVAAGIGTSSGVAMDAAADDEPRSQGLLRIGPYRIIRVIGEGGMGVVYEAEEDRPRRRVALKLIRPGFATAGMLRRFEFEADVLARLEHPGIARIYHAGVADTGHGPQPYFAMELVDGRSLDQYVAHAKLTTAQRLELFIEICAAVHHAHTKGVIHRDLKPANILINSEGKPKILDFGVARAVDGDVQATTLHTVSGQVVGTLPYMAPEQAAGKVNDLDTSSDVYALGVIAFELLGGRLPYAVKDRPMYEAVRVICEQEPSRLSSIDRSLRGDVETIVRKALEKDRTRRYQTAGELGADLQRYLNYEPIAARPPSTWYQFTKFAKRNKLLVGSTLVVIALLTSGIITTSMLAYHARQQQRAAQESRDAAAAVVDFLTNDVLAGATPQRLPDAKVRDAIVRAMLDPAANRIQQRFANQPMVEVQVRHVLALSYLYVGSPDLALPHARAELTRANQVLGPHHHNTLSAMNSLAMILHRMGMLDEAEALFRKSLAERRRYFGDKQEDTLRSMYNLGYLLQSVNKLDEAEALCREAVNGCREKYGDNHPDTLNAIGNLSVVLQTQGKLEEAQPLLRQMYENSRQTLGEKHAVTLNSMSNYAYSLFALGRFDESEPLMIDCLRSRREVMGNQHMDTMVSIINLGVLFTKKGEHARAEPLFAELFELAHTVPMRADYAAEAVSHYGPCLVRLGKFSDAEAPLREAERRLRDTNQTQSENMLEVLDGLAQTCDYTGRTEEAATWRAARAKVLASTQPVATQPATTRS